jgi:hypothetical protein
MENPQLARIRLVTRRYAELQGLGRCLLGAGSVAGAGVSGVVPGDYDIFVIGLVWLSVVVSGRPIVLKYYADRFGRVAQPSESQQPKFWLLFLLFGVPTMIAQAVGPGYPNAMFLSIAIFLAWQLVRDWPVRKHLIIDVGAASLASALFVGETMPGTGEYWAMAFTITGAAAMITGALDHRLLVRTLPGVHDRQEHRYADTL